MHILIDGRMVSNTGIGRLLENLVAALGTEMLASNSSHAGRHRLTVLTNAANEHVRRFPGSSTRVMRYAAPIYSLREQVLLPLEIARCRPDLLHFPNFNIPLATRVPYVLMLCDIIYYTSPALCPSRLAYRYARTMIALSVRRARRVFTISEYSKREIVEHLGVPPGQVSVVYPAIPAGVFRPDFSADQVDAARARFQIRRPYLFYVGNHEPRKQLHTLTRAFRELRDRSCYQLVIGGPIDPRRKALYDEAADLVAAGDVIFTGRLFAPPPHGNSAPASSDVLPMLYAGATAFVFPSSYEGFGLPPLEAMACGTPVICSNATSLPEVVGDAAVLVPPGDVGALRDALERVLANPGLREELRGRGFEQVRRFSWERSAREVLALYEQALATSH